MEKLSKQPKAVPKADPNYAVLCEYTDNDGKFFIKNIVKIITYFIANETSIAVSKI